MTSNAQTQWPELPKSGFVSGRIANEDDYKRGDVLFFSHDGPGRDQSVVATPYATLIPQYAYLIKDGTETPVIITQAKQISVPGKTVVVASAKKFDGSLTGGYLNEFKLLGIHPPPER